MTQLSAGSGDRTHTGFRPQDFKSETGTNSSNDLRADARPSGSIQSPAVYGRLRVSVTPGVTPYIEGVGVTIRADCECGICRAARGLDPLATAQLKARREAKR